MSQEDRRQAGTLTAVGDDEGDLRIGRVGKPVVATDSDDVAIDEGDQRFAVLVVDRDEVVDLVDAEVAMETEVSLANRFERKRLVESDQVRSISRFDRPDVDRASAFGISIERLGWQQQGHNSLRDDPTVERFH